MIQSKRTTRNMLQSINIYDYMPSQDNLFNSQLSCMSGFMASQRSVRSNRETHQEAADLMKKSKEKASTRMNMKLKQTDSFD